MIYNNLGLKNKSLALFFTEGISLEKWQKLGSIERELAIYNQLSNYFEKIYLFTYGEEDKKFAGYVEDNIIIIPKTRIKTSFFYSFLIPFIHYKILKEVTFFKTNQMWGSWTAILSKLFFRGKLVVRTGYILSINFKKENPDSFKNKFMTLLEKVSYKFADGIITSSKTNFEFVNSKYKPKNNHVIIPNYVDTEMFKPINVEKKENSICFIGRLAPEKNLLNLLKAIKDQKYSITLIGSGKLFATLKEFSDLNDLKTDFKGNIPNNKLPEIINNHEVFILPSLWEGMPKSLIEAMACGLPVIGTDVVGINEVIENEFNGLLCQTDYISLRSTINRLMEDDNLKKKLGVNAQKTIIENFSLNHVLEKELELYFNLMNNK